MSDDPIFEFPKCESQPAINCPLCKIEMKAISLETDAQLMCLTEGCYLYWWTMPIKAVEAINLLIEGKNERSD